MVKLELNKLKKVNLLLVLFLSVTSCKEKLPLINSELICPGNYRILVKFTRAADLKEAIYTAYIAKKARRTNENYTVVKLKDGRSIGFNKIPPELAMTCIVQESYMGFVDRSYVHHPKPLN